MVKVCEMLKCLPSFADPGRGNSHVIAKLDALLKLEAANSTNPNTTKAPMQPCLNVDCQHINAKLCNTGHCEFYKEYSSVLGCNDYRAERQPFAERSDYLEASGQELESKRVCQLLAYLYEKVDKSVPEWVKKAADNYYGNLDRLDEATKMLCCAGTKLQEILLCGYSWKGKQ